MISFNKFYETVSVTWCIFFLYVLCEEHYEVQILLTPKPVDLSKETILERLDRKIYNSLLNPPVWQGDILLQDIKLISKQFIKAKAKWLEKNINKDDELIKSSLILFKQEAPLFLQIVVTNDGALLQERFNWTANTLLNFYDLRLEVNLKWDELYSVIASKNPEMTNSTNSDLWKIL